MKLRCGCFLLLFKNRPTYFQQNIKDALSLRARGVEYCIRWFCKEALLTKTVTNAERTTREALILPLASHVCKYSFFLFGRVESIEV